MFMDKFVIYVYVVVSFIYVCRSRSPILVRRMTGVGDHTENKQFGFKIEVGNFYKKRQSLLLQTSKNFAQEIISLQEVWNCLLYVDD